MTSAPSAPAPPKFNPIDLGSATGDTVNASGTGFTGPDPATSGGVYESAFNADENAYNFSNANLKARYPGLVTMNTQQLNNSLADLQNPLRDPTVQNNFVNQGVGNALNAYGGGSSGGINAGSERGTVAQTVAGLTSQKQDYDQSNFASLLNLPVNQEQGIGLSGGDAFKLAFANSLGLNASANANNVYQTQTANAQNAASSQNTQAAIGTSLAVASLIATIVGV
jgi:hypothetical protein